MKTDPIALIMTLIHVTRATETRHRVILAGKLLRDALGVLFQAEYHCTRDLAVNLAVRETAP